ncbi:agmatinase [Desulfosoma caldarium]|uniref:Agmatinase n=1 Tax=Desulfosoma caldarium TaxID=610254 RepID=A0A3N1VLY5_9BACT|nr:agmatinase [Desulfosoma caldarium]ROR02950.1 agmatinase [Desulfosoma caldarium]
MDALDHGLSEAFQEALEMAFSLHRRQFRKGTRVPYVSHLLAVAAMVLENGGDEASAIAALLHDAAEDQGGQATLEAIRRRFGDRVADLVRSCSDCLESPKPPWQERKEAYLEHLKTASDDAVLISLADKVHNAGTIVADLEREGPGVWDRFQAGKLGTLWYYKALVRCFRRRGLYPQLVRQLDRLVERLRQLAARVTVLGIPFDANASYRRGPALAPARLREALYLGSTNLTAESGLDLGASDEWTDAGDLSFSRLDGIVGTDGMVTKVQEAVEKILRTGSAVLAVGGDHSITVPVVRALAAHHGPLNILDLDAHPDLYPALDGNPMSHGSAFTRILEEGLAQRLVQVGIRTMNETQRKVAERFGVEILPMDRWTGECRFRFDGPVYVSLDVDCLDPAHAPGVSHQEPGGLSPRDVIRIIHGLEGRLVGADLVEINPERDASGVTAALGAKLLKELLARLLAPKAVP